MSPIRPYVCSIARSRLSIAGSSSVDEALARRACARPRARARCACGSCRTRPARAARGRAARRPRRGPPPARASTTSPRSSNSAPRSSIELADRSAVTAAGGARTASAGLPVLRQAESSDPPRGVMCGRSSLLVPVDDFVVGVDDVLGRSARPRRRLGGSASRACAVRVDDLGELVAGLLERLGRGLDLVDVVALERRLGCARAPPRPSVLVVLGNLVAEVLEGLLGGVDERVGGVADLDLFLALAVLVGVRCRRR